MQQVHIHAMFHRFRTVHCKRMIPREDTSITRMCILATLPVSCTVWVKNASSRKRIMQVFITSLVGELSLQWIIPGHHRGRLFIGSTKSLFHLHTRKDFKITDICLRCRDKRIYRHSFFSEFVFLLKHRSMPEETTILWWMQKFMANTMSKDSIPYVIVSVSYDGLCKCL